MSLCVYLKTCLNTCPNIFAKCFAKVSRQRFFLLVSLLLLTGPLQADEFPYIKASGAGLISVTEGGGFFRSLGAATMSLGRRQVSVQLEIDRSGKMSIIQDFKLGMQTWQNRFNVIWKFDTNVPGERRYQIINAGDGKIVGQGFCGTRVCDYQMELPEQNLKISERIEVVQGKSKTDLPAPRAFDLIGHLSDSGSWLGNLGLYYRVQLTPVPSLNE